MLNFKFNFILKLNFGNASMSIAIINSSGQVPIYKLLRLSKRKKVDITQAKLSRRILLEFNNHKVTETRPYLIKGMHPIEIITICLNRKEELLSYKQTMHFITVHWYWYLNSVGLSAQTGHWLACVADETAPKAEYLYRIGIYIFHSTLGILGLYFNQQNVSIVEYCKQMFKPEKMCCCSYQLLIVLFISLFSNNLLSTLKTVMYTLWIDIETYLSRINYSTIDLELRASHKCDYGVIHCRINPLYAMQAQYYVFRRRLGTDILFADIKKHLRLAVDGNFISENTARLVKSSFGMK